MINITFISTYAYNYFFPGKIKHAGGNVRPFNLAKEFAKLSDYRVSCIVGDFGQPAVLEVENVRLIKVPINRPAATINVFRKLKSIHADIFLDFCASPRLLIFYLLKKMTGCRYIFLTGHDNDVTGNYREVENRLYDWAYTYGLKHADSIIGQVEEHVELLKKNYDLSSNYVLSPYFNIVPQQEKQEKQFTLWVGRAASYKNPEAFLSLVKKFPNEKFIMICNESPYDNGFMTSIREELPFLKNLKFYDYIAYPDIQKYFKTAKLLVNTSESEGFPNTFIEAAMNYTPILSLSVDPNGMLSNFKGGVCCGGDQTQFIKEFKELVRNDRKLEEYGENAYRYAEKNHQLSMAVEKIDKIIRGVLNPTDYR